MVENDERLLIKNMYFRDKQKINAISKQTSRHHSTIKRILFPEKYEKKRRQIMSYYNEQFDQLNGYLNKTLDDYPTIKATRLQQMLQDLGYNIPIHQVRIWVKKIRPEKSASKAFLKLNFLPGEQAQVDWASCGSLQHRKLSLFVMVLSYSRAIYARFYFNQNTYSVLAAHQHAFKYFKGVPKEILYDNMRTAVKSRLGKKVAFNDNLLELAAQYCYTPRACKAYAPWQKGRVEKLIRYIRDNFLTARRFIDIMDANKQLAHWLDNIANKRKWSQDRSRSVWSVLHEERQSLYKCNNHPDEIYHKLLYRVKKTPYIRFDLNSYSLPYQYCNKVVTVMASEDSLRIFDGHKEIAHHKRSYLKSQCIECTEHLEGLIKNRSSAHPGHKKEHLFKVLPSSEKFIEQLVHRGGHTQTIFRQIYKIIEKYNLKRIEEAMIMLLDKDLVAIDSLSHVLQTIPRNQAPIYKLKLKGDLQKIHVNSQDMSKYNS